ncbi:MAG: hypothetical protein LIP11_04185 [Clostridiales bacterium]|nr:hypothetical protein [Clostridiales bacterium]
MKERWEKQAVYWDLTPGSVVLCAILGFGVEVLLFAMTGIRISEVPGIVLGFLWPLSGILVSGVLILAASLWDRIHGRILSFRYTA